MNCTMMHGSTNIRFKNFCIVTPSFCRSFSYRVSDISFRFSSLCGLAKQPRLEMECPDIVTKISSIMEGIYSQGTVQCYSTVITRMCSSSAD